MIFGSGWQGTVLASIAGRVNPMLIKCQRVMLRTEDSGNFAELSLRALRFQRQPSITREWRNWQTRWT